MNRKYIAVLALTAFMLTSCKDKALELSTDEVRTAASAQSGTVIELSSKTDIVFSEDDVQVSSEGISADGTYLTITQPGEYTVSGECSQGQVLVDVDEEIYPDGEVTLILEGLTLSNSSDAPIFVRSIGKGCTVCTSANTVNTITDSSDYEGEDKSKGAIYSKAAVSFNGTGELDITGRRGITSKKSVQIDSGTIRVNSYSDCIKASDNIEVNGGDIDLYSYEGGSYTSSDTQGSFVTDMQFTDRAESEDMPEFDPDNFGGAPDFQDTRRFNEEGISEGDPDSAERAGNDDSRTGDGAPSKGGMRGGFGGGMGGFGGGMNEGNSNKPDVSAKGLKSGGDITINAGTLNIDTSDDALHCAGTLTVKDGNITISTADDGLHSDDYLIIDGGDIRINKSYEGIEAASITVNDGTIIVNSSDDGFNAAGNKTSLSEYTLVFNGGYIFVRNGGDGIDSNGTTEINGGTIIVAGPTGGGDSPLDSEHGITFNGGIVMAVGSSQGMWSEDIIGNIDGDYWLNTNIGTEALITVCDKDGTVISAFEQPLDGTSIGMVYCNSDVSIDEIQVYAGGTYSGTLNEDGYGEGGTVTGGTLLEQSENVSSGSFFNGGRGGRMF